MTSGLRKRVLCILPRVPAGPLAGGELRTLTILQALQGEHQLTVVAPVRTEQRIPAHLQDEVRAKWLPVPMPGWGEVAFNAVARRGRVPLSFAKYSLRRSVLNQLMVREAPEIVHFDHPHVASFARSLRGDFPGMKTVLNAHNVEAEVLERCEPLYRGWKRDLVRREARRVRVAEEAIVRQVDLVLSCSEREACAFRAMGAERVVCVPNGVPELPPWHPQERKDLVFVGSFDWMPNVDAALWLVKEIWPRVRASLQGARLVLVGRNPPRHLRSYESGDVLVTGTVPSVAPFLASAKATAIPLRAGSGTRIKILEAWAAGVPVVATALAAEGLPYRDGANVLLADTTECFVQTLRRLWSDQEGRQALIRGGHETARTFSLARIRSAALDAYSELAEGLPRMEEVARPLLAVEGA